MSEILKINFVLPSGKSTPLNDTLMEVRSFLQETTELYLYQNYSLTYNEKPLNEYIEFSNLNVQDTITVKINPFDERSARYHFKKVQELLNRPEKITQLLGSQTKNLKKEKTNKITSNNIQLKSVLNGELKTYDLCEPRKTEPVGRLVESFCLSGYNPPPSFRRIQDDYFYISFKSTEGIEYQITANPSGFFVNNSNVRVFDSSQNFSFHTQKNLFDLLQNLSASFMKSCQTLLTAEMSDLFVSNTQVYQQFGRTWFEQPQKGYLWDQSREFNELFGVNTEILGDWNEDLQLCKNLPKDDFYQRINRDRTILKIHNDFLNAAVEGAKAVINGNIMAANPMDPKETQVFIFNQLFFSYAVETPETFRQESGEEATFSYSSVNQDFRNQNLLQRMDIPGLHLQNTAIIDYKGQRIMVQSVVPGILNQEQNDQTQYGSIDDGKTIQSNPEFHELLSIVSKRFYLEQEIQFQDESGQKHSINGSLEVKGVLGSDKRKYILDSMRLSPRDMNYMGVDNNCCVIRLELIENYIMSQYIETAQLRLQEYKKQNDQKQETKEEKVEEKVQETKDPETLRQEAIQKHKEEQEKHMEQRKQDFIKFQEFLIEVQNQDKEKYLFNSNIYTNCSPINVPQEHTDNLQKLADYINNVAIPNLIKEMYQEDQGRLADSKSISSLFHTYGVNNRYLGKVCEKINGEVYPNLKQILQKTIYVRAVKHVLRNKIKNAKSTFLPHTIAHIFNCIFSQEKQKEILNSGKIKFEIECQVFDQKKKNKKNKQKSIIYSLSDTPNSIFHEISNIAQKRYGTNLPNLTYTRFNLLSVIRDVCLSLGIVISYREYLSEQDDAKKYQDFPFQFDDICDIRPLVKNIEAFNGDAKQHMELAERFFQEENYEQASEMYQNTVNILLNLHGPIKSEIAVCYQKLAQIFYSLKNIEKAVTYQKIAVQTLKKLYGCDHYLTAHSFLNLGVYYFGAQLYAKAEKYLLKSIYFKSLIGGELNPDVQQVMMNLAMLYQQSGQQQAAINCLLESNEAIVRVFGEKSIRSAGILQAIAMVHFEIQDFKKAVQYQRKAVEIFSVLKTDDPRAIESQYYLKNLTFMMEEQLKKQDQGSELQPSRRPFGSNKVKKGLQNQQQSQIQEQQIPQEHPIQQDKTAEENKIKEIVIILNQEREILQEKLRVAKMNMKYQRNQRNFKVMN